MTPLKYLQLNLIDKYNRRVDYLRIGVTDRCNLRCRYCMPEEGIDFSNREDLLTFEEIVRVSKIFRNLGVSKVRLTGGEPFVRKDITKLLESLCQIFPAVHITTNATKLDVLMLKSFGVKGLNISIDSLDREKFFAITRRDQSVQVMDNIYHCVEQGLPIKLNMVVMAGVNDNEIVDFIKFGMEHGVTVRFIEAMPFNAGDGNRDVFLSATDILEKIKFAFPTVKRQITNVVSAGMPYQIDDYLFDVIPAYSRSLCGSCNRIRLTPKGELMNCLYAQEGADLRSVLRSGATDQDVIRVIEENISHKLKDGFEAEKLKTSDAFRSMTTIGG